MKTVTYKVSNISCAGCGNAISNALTQNGAVEKVDVDLVEKLVHVVYNEQDTNVKILADKINSMGYNATYNHSN